MILNFGFCLNQKENYSDTIILYNATINFFECLYFNDDLPFMNIDNFYRKYYVICLNNLADTYFAINDFINALSICNKAIDKSKELNILNVLPFLVKLKVELFYNLSEIKKAKETYICFKSICQLTDNMAYLKKSTNTFKHKYPKLF